MKKIIAIAVMFALLVGSAFALDVSGAVFGTVNLLEASTFEDAKRDGDKHAATASGEFNRVRGQLYGETEDGKFAGWVRIGDGKGDGLAAGYAQWKPIDAFTLRFGGNPDGFWGKDGITRWGFYGTPTDVGVTFQGDNAWGGGFGENINMSSSFYGGFGADALMLEIKPIDVLEINLGIPWNNGKAKDFYRQVTAQVGLNLAFGTIALTYAGGPGVDKDKDWSTSTTTGDGEWKWVPVDPDDPAGSGGEYQYLKPDGKPGDPDKVNYGNAPNYFSGDLNGRMFLYFGGNFGPIGIDFGFGFGLPYTYEDVGKVMPQLGLGLGFKFDNDGIFGVKARVGTMLAGKYTPETGDAYKVPVKFLFDVLPYIRIGDNATFFLSAGIVMTGKLKDENYVDLTGSEMYKETGGLRYFEDDSDWDGVRLAWHVNPYIQIGGDWGPKFLAGIKLWQTGDKISGKADADPKKFIRFAIPIAIQVDF